MKRRKGEKHIVETTEEYGFIDTKYLCVGIVDIYHWNTVRYSIAQKYRNKPLAYVMKKECSYYSIFINTMDAIARNFGAVVTNVSHNFTPPDTVNFFFPKTSEPCSDKTPFKDVLKCGLAMQAAHDDMNQKYYEEGLDPIINYQISADCGEIEVGAKSKDPSIIDVFGPTLFMCLKINELAPLNRMVIGKNLYDMINDSFEDDYRFTKIHEYPSDENHHSQNPYSVYLVSRK
jgi:hypothetical protein